MTNAPSYWFPYRWQGEVWMYLNAFNQMSLGQFCEKLSMLKKKKSAFCRSNFDADPLRKFDLIVTWGFHWSFLIGINAVRFKLLLRGFGRILKMRLLRVHSVLRGIQQTHHIPNPIKLSCCFPPEAPCNLPFVIHITAVISHTNQSDLRFMLSSLTSTFALLPHSWNTGLLACFPTWVPHQSTRSAAQSPSRFADPLDPSMTIILSLHTFAPYHSIRLSFHLSLASPSLWHLFNVFLTIKHHTHNSVRPWSRSSVIQSKLQ